MKLKNTLLTLMLILSISMNAQKTFLDFRNESTPIFPGCEDAENKEECYMLKVKELISTKINEYTKNHPVKLDKIIIDVIIRTETNGKSAIVRLKTAESSIDILVREVLENLPEIEPIKNLDGSPASSSMGFIVTLEKNKVTNSYTLFNPPSNTNKWKSQSHPFPMKIEYAHFKNCPEEDKFVTDCFQEKFINWITKEVGNEINSFKGHKVKIKITVDEEGKVSIYSIKTDSEKLEAVIKKAFNNFPQMEPAVVNNNISKMTYEVMPITF